MTIALDEEPATNWAPSGSFRRTVLDRVRTVETSPPTAPARRDTRERREIGAHILAAAVERASACKTDPDPEETAAETALIMWREIAVKGRPIEKALHLASVVAKRRRQCHERDGDRLSLGLARLRAVVLTIAGAAAGNYWSRVTESSSLEEREASRFWRDARQGAPNNRLPHERKPSHIRIARPDAVEDRLIAVIDGRARCGSRDRFRRWVEHDVLVKTTPTQMAFAWVSFVGGDRDVEIEAFKSAMRRAKERVPKNDVVTELMSEERTTPLASSF